MQRMSSISPECNELKHKYDDCFHAWFSERFLKGDTHDSCAPLLAAYSDCVQKALREKQVNLDEVEKELVNTVKSEDQQKKKNS